MRSFLLALSLAVGIGCALTSNVALAQQAKAPEHKAVSACRTRIAQLSGAAAHLDQLKPESLPDVLGEIDQCVLHQAQLTRAEVALAYGARLNIEEEMKRREAQQNMTSQPGIATCRADLRSAVEQGLKPVDARFVGMTEESLDKQYNQARECMKSFGNDEKVRLSAYLASTFIQVERFRRIAVKFDQSIRAMAARYNTDTGDLTSKLTALRQDYIAHLDQDIRTYEELRRQQRAEDLAAALNSFFQSSSASRSAPRVQRVYQPPTQITCTTETTPPLFPGMSSWAHTNCY